MSKMYLISDDEVNTLVRRRRQEVVDWIESIFAHEADWTQEERLRMVREHINAETIIYDYFAKDSVEVAPVVEEDIYEDEIESTEDTEDSSEEVVHVSDFVDEDLPEEEEGPSPIELAVEEAQAQAEERQDHIQQLAKAEEQAVAKYSEETAANNAETAELDPEEARRRLRRLYQEIGRIDRG